MTQEQLVTMTPEAAAAILELMAEQNLEKHALRIFISGVG